MRPRHGTTYNGFHFFLIACSVAAVVITEQSPPQVIFKSKFMEDAYGIQLLLAPGVEIQAVSKVKAKIVSDVSFL